MESAYHYPRVENAVELLEKNHRCTLGELASSCKISRSRLSLLFKQQTGDTVKQYRRNHRLEEAARMLATTQMSIKEISYHVGYQHTSSFVRAFRNEFKLSPRHYRGCGCMRAVERNAN